MDIKNELNEEQLKAALDTEGAVLVTAGAGSGKTRLLTFRIAHIVSDLGVSPFSVLAITFTNKAAKEMKVRLESVLDNSRDIWVSTFHSMCVRILRRHSALIGFTKDFTILDDDDTERIVKRLCADYKVENEKLYKTIVGVIDNSKNKGQTSDDWFNANKHYFTDSADIYRVYVGYEEYLRKNNAMDFNDLLTNTLKLFLEHGDVLEYYQNKFKYILVDEFQDTNVIQYNLIRLLSMRNGNVFVVGDEDQSIYSWRGADFTNMQRFISDYNARVYKLEQNYRSSQNILNVANNVIKNNSTRIPKKLWSNRNGGEQITIYEASSDMDEADYVARNIKRLVEMGKSYRDFAVLMRINALTRLIEQRFIMYDIPYKIHGGFRFFDRKEIKDLISYVRVLVNPQDEISLMRIINFPKRGIGDSTILQAKNYALLNGKTLYEVITGIDDNKDLPSQVVKKLKLIGRLLTELEEDSKTMSISAFIGAIIDKTGMRDLYSDGSEESESRLMNIGSFVAYAKEYESSVGNDLSEFLQEIALFSEGDDADGNSVFISTVHSAKGMEFDTVFVIGVEEGVFPLRRSTFSETELEEERRLMYVAITRTMNKLFITYSTFRNLFGNASITFYSRFLGEIDSRFSQSAKKKAREETAERLFNGNPFMDSVKSSSPFSNGVKRLPENDSAQYEVGMRIRHKKFGEGRIVDITGPEYNRSAKISFDNGATMLLALRIAPIEIVGDANDG